MIGAIIKDNIVENLIVINDSQVETISAALNCEIVDARPYGLAPGDLRTASGWTRNAGGEQIILPLLEGESYDSYSVIAAKNVELQNNMDEAETIGAEMAIAEVMNILSGEVD